MTMILFAPFLVALAYTEPVYAYQFSPANCTLPEQDLHNFVSAPNIRGTLEIFWTCLATIIACTYTVLHLNIPEQRDGRDMDKGWRGDLKWWWKGIESYVWMTVATILAPEFYTLLAMMEWAEARYTLRRLLALDLDTCPDSSWSLVHAFYMSMGGFAIHSTKHQDSTMHIGQPLTPRYYSITLSVDSVIQMLQVRDPSWKITHLPTKDEIQDRSKSDILAKAIVAIQILYFCASCLTRAARHLPITLFELGTLGFAACSLISYGLLFHKPRSVNTPLVLARFEGEVDPRLETILSRNGALKRISNFDRPNNIHLAKILGIETPVILGLLMAVVMGAIHLAGWNFAFPTTIDKWLWRMNSIASIVFAMTSVFIIPTSESLMVISIAIYSVARVALIVEMIRCLFYLPSDAFTATWTANIPHIS